MYFKIDSIANYGNSWLSRSLHDTGSTCDDAPPPHL
jgi:hypothetical protein